MSVSEQRIGRLPWLPALIALVLLPASWVLGLDQAVWLLVGFVLGVIGLSLGVDRLALGLGSAFLAVLIVAGALGAEGYRWLTLTRETLIVSAFFGAFLGSASLVREGLIKPLVMLLVLFVGLSSAVSVVAFGFDAPLRFLTPVAPLVPSDIAETGLGRLSLVQRSVAEESYFLGHQFLRPKGLFLFSTSQAVAQAAAVSLSLAAAIWYRRQRWFFVACTAVIAIALVMSTTRAPLFALAIAVVVAWFLRQRTVGSVTIVVPLRGSRFAMWLAGLTAVGMLALVGGILQPLTDLITTRSLEGRAGLYERTLEEWRDRPLIGWGTERDWTPTPPPEPTPTLVPTPTPTPAPTPPPERPDTEPQIPPLGSHSQYLGVLFKQGMLGLTLFLAVVLILVTRLYRTITRQAGHTALVGVGALATLIAAVTESMWLDPATAVVVASVWGMVWHWGTQDRTDVLA